MVKTFLCCVIFLLYPMTYLLSILYVTLYHFVSHTTLISLLNRMFTHCIPYLLMSIFSIVFYLSCFITTDINPHLNKLFQYLGQDFLTSLITQSHTVFNPNLTTLFLKSTVLQFYNLLTYCTTY